MFEELNERRVLTGGPETGNEAVRTEFVGPILFKVGALYKGKIVLKLEVFLSITLSNFSEDQLNAGRVEYTLEHKGHKFHNTEKVKKGELAQGVHQNMSKVIPFI